MVFIFLVFWGTSILCCGDCSWFRSTNSAQAFPFLCVFTKACYYLFFLYFWLCWVFCWAPAFSSCGALASHSDGVSHRPPGLWSAGAMAVAEGLSCSTARGIFPNQGSDPCLLHWQVNSLPLSHQGSPCYYLFDDSHSDRSEVVSHCDFHLHLPDDQWYWATSHGPVGHLYLIFGKMCVQVLCLFFGCCLFVLTLSCKSCHLQPHEWTQRVLC